MPVNIIPTKIRFVSILFNNTYTNRLPKKYRLYGYYNCVWELIIDDYVNDDYEYETYNSIPNIAYTKNIENAKNYNKYALIVNKIGNTHVLAMSNFEIFGREVINEKKEIFKYDFDNDNGSYNITFDNDVIADVLIVGGGGGGGNSIGGAAGAGGLIFQTNVKISKGTYNITIGKGGDKSQNGRDYGRNGEDSVFLDYTAYGGGGGTGQSFMYDSDLLSMRNSFGLAKHGKGGRDGGSGAGGTRWGNTGGSGISDQGNGGGNGSNNSPWAGGGGGGAGGQGYNKDDSNNRGKGGIGLSEKLNIDFKTHFNITDLTIGEHQSDNVYFSGGGAGWDSGGGLGGGGDMNTNGQNNTGGGGGGGNGGNGGSGIMIIRYRLDQPFITDVSSDPVTTPITSINTLDSNYKYVVFQNIDNNQTSYNITFSQNTNCDILIVGGGGSGGVRDAGGGGAGGLIYLTNVNILNSNLSVGNGGASRTSGEHISGYKGNNSFIIIDGITYTAEGGGKGGQYYYDNNSTGSGGSGGGGGGNNSTGGTGNQSISESGGYGNDGANGSDSYSGGGGGGARGAGTRNTEDTGGNGGIGMDFSSIFGTEYGDNGWFAGGGGMGSGTGANGTGGLGGGGNGSNSGDAEGGMDGTGGGGGGHRNSGGTSGKGGDGIIIIRYVLSNLSLNSLELKTELLDDYGCIIETNNTVLNRQELIHGIKNGIMTSYNITKYVLFKEERLYPPYYKSDIILFENFFIENKIYGNGKYEIEYSSTYNENDKPFNIFRNDYYNGMWEFNNYIWNNQPLNTLSSRSSFNGTSYLKDSSYTGEWITINLPYKILLTKIIIVLLESNSLNISTYDNAIYYFPHDFRIYGKNNDEDWELIIQKNINKTYLNNKYDNINNLNVAFEYKLSDNDRLTKFKTFQKYGLVVSQIGGKEYLNFSKWDIYGKELNTIIDNKPDNIPSKKNVKFSQLSKVFDDVFNNKNIKITNYYLENLDKYDHNVSIPNNGIISLSDFKSTSSFIDNIPLVDNIYARYETKYESLYISDNIVKQWYDSSGNNRHIITYRGNPIVKYFEKGTKGTVGKNFFNVIKGDYNSGYKLPFRLDFDYTFCYVARYIGDKNTTTYNRRIFDSSSGTGQNTLWGFDANYSGRSHSYKSGWHTTTHKQHSETDYWMIGIETQNTARYNGQDCTNYYEYLNTSYPQKHSDYNVQLTINYGYYTGETYSTQTSNWEIAEIIIYNNELNLNEKINVEQYLAKKYGHISFSNVIEDLNEYKSTIKSQNYANDLSDMWYYTYNGYKYGYSDITDKFYGPVNFRFYLYKYDDNSISNYYWIADLINTASTNSNTNYSNRNGNIKTYNLTILKTDAEISITSGGGGGGGGGIGSYWGWMSSGGGAGGQSYIYNYTQTSDVNYIIQVGSKGSGNGYNSSGGDSHVKWSDSDISYDIIGYGGQEGAWYSSMGQGGNYYVSPNLSNIGGAKGGNSIIKNFYGHIAYARNPGGAISTQLTNIVLNTGVTFWNILDEFFPNWRSINVEYHWNRGKYYGSGGSGGQNYKNGAPDKWARPGYSGGPGYVFIVLDFNNSESSSSNIVYSQTTENNTSQTTENNTYNSY